VLLAAGQSRVGRIAVTVGAVLDDVFVGLVGVAEEDGMMFELDGDVEFAPVGKGLAGGLAEGQDTLGNICTLEDGTNLDDDAAAAAGPADARDLFFSPTATPTPIAIGMAMSSSITTNTPQRYFLLELGSSSWLSATLPLVESRGGVGSDARAVAARAAAAAAKIGTAPWLPRP